MPTQHIVAEGECISSIAFRHGLAPDTVWRAPENAGLRQRRKNPNILVAGDVVAIPARQEKSAGVETDRRHTFRRRGVPEKLRLQFLVAGFPRAEERYELTVDGVIVAHDELTDAEGRIERFIAPDARTARVRLLGTGEEYSFALGRLDPVDTPRGALGRLKSLGFYAGSLGDGGGAGLSRALQAFQDAHGLEITGALDDETQRALEAKYGG